jgi:hypothetical protein
VIILLVTLNLAKNLTMLVAPAASASASTHAVQKPAHSLGAAHPASADTTTDTFCLNTQSNECLNVEDCNNFYSYVLQLYNISTGGDCSTDWDVTLEGYVGQTTSVGNVFGCGNDWNAKFYFDPVYLLQFNSPVWGEPGTAQDLLSNNSIFVNQPDPTYYFVATGSNLGDTQLVDPWASCQDSKLMYLYAKGKTNGSEEYESSAPPSLSYWDLSPV